MKRILFLAPVVAFLALMGVFFAGLHRDPSILPSMLIDKPLPAFSLASVHPGEKGASNADFGGEPMLLNVFASTCGPCRIEHPLFMKLKADGMKIVGLDWKETPDKGAAWLEQYGNPYTLTGSDASGRAGIDLGVSGTPETFVVDRRGRVRYRHVGAITPDDWKQKVRPLLEKLQAES